MKRETLIITILALVIIFAWVYLNKPELVSPGDITNLFGG